MKQFSFEGLSDYVEVVSVLDGDTISVAVPISMEFGESKKIISDTFRLNVRLYGIDTCEIKSKDPHEASLAQKAKARLIQLIEESNKIFIKFYKYDKYGRILGELYGRDPGLSRDEPEQSRDPGLSRDEQAPICSFNNILLNENLAKSYFGGTKR